MKWTAAADAELTRLYPLHDNTTIGKLMGCTEPAVLNRARHLGLKKPAGWVNVGCFNAARSSWNAGKKGWTAGGRSAETRFKAGQKPHTWNPIGHERITDDGYLQRKVTDTGVTRRDYVNVHWLIWREAGREIPPGHALVFKDGDKTHIALDNLQLITRRELMARNSVHQLPKALAELVQLRGALLRKINRAERAQQEASAS
jgi:hypothetical protein